MCLQHAGRGGWDKADLIKPAVVIPWRDEGDRGECLKFTLRGLRHLPHSRVVIAGDPVPAWAKGLDSVVLEKKPNRYEDGQANVVAGLRVLDQPWTYICHDDMVVNRPVDWIAPSNRGLLAAYRNRGNYYDRARGVARWLAYEGFKNPINFNVHLPFLVNVEKYLVVVDETAHLPAGFRQSIYGNVYRLRTKRINDPKVVNVGQKPHPRWPVWATSDRSFANGYIGKQIRLMFPAPGQYERQGETGTSIQDATTQAEPRQILVP